MIYGINNVSAVIRRSKFTSLKVYSSSPRSKDSDPCLLIADADSPDDLADSFEDEMSYRSAGNQYWLKLYSEKNSTPVVETFMKESADSKESPVARELGTQVPSSLSAKEIIDLSSENARLKVELDNAKETIDQLNGEILDLEDELEDQEPDTLTSSIMSILSGITNPSAMPAMAGADVLSAFNEIKAIAPDAEILIVKLGSMAKNNPEQLKGFIETLNKNLV